MTKHIADKVKRRIYEARFRAFQNLMPHKLPFSTEIVPNLRVFRSITHKDVT